eukprot:m.88859 g.88859  ORF g.88859 m.88859 type:complete len:181 (+) comp14838_c0_seq2:1254-1796(+)
MDLGEDTPTASPFDRMSQGAPERRDEIPGLIAGAKDLLSSERPMAALESLTDALRIIGGERLIMQSLHEARQQYWNSPAGEQQRHEGAVDSLSRLFQQCVMSTVPERSSPEPEMVPTLPQRYHDLLTTSVAAHTHGTEFLEAAAAHPSSVICSACGAVVKESRMEAHMSFWCETIADADK